MTQVLLSEMGGGLMVLTMNRPESRNALNPALCLALAEHLAAAAADPAVRTVVLAGAGGTFCVGGDVKAMNEGSGRDAPEAERIANLRARMEASRLLPFEFWTLDPEPQKRTAKAITQNGLRADDLAAGLEDVFVPFTNVFDDEAGAAATRA